MLSGYRLHYAAARGLLIVGVLLGADSLAQENQPEKRPQTNQTEAAAPRADNASPAGSAKDDEPKTDWGKPNCGNPNNQPEADLCQQRRMAKSAEDAVFLNQIQTGIGVIGGILLLATLIANAYATLAARHAAKASIKSADAAEAAVKHAADNAERQLRAYVSAEVDNGEIKIAGDEGATNRTATLNLVMRNRGQTPAHGLTHWVKFDTADYPVPNLDYTPPVEYGAKVVLHPGAGRIRPQEKKLSSELLKQVRAGDATRLYLWGVVSYVDAFGEKRETKFRLMYGGPKSTERSTMWWCDEGNEAS